MRKLELQAKVVHETGSFCHKQQAFPKITFVTITLDGSRVATGKVDGHLSSEKALEAFRANPNSFRRWEMWEFAKSLFQVQVA